MRTCGVGSLYIKRLSYFHFSGNSVLTRVYDSGTLRSSACVVCVFLFWHNDDFLMTSNSGCIYQRSAVHELLGLAYGIDEEKHRRHALDSFSLVCSLRSSRNLE